MLIDIDTKDGKVTGVELQVKDFGVEDGPEHADIEDGDEDPTGEFGRTGEGVLFRNVRLFRLP